MLSLLGFVYGHELWHTWRGNSFGYVAVQT